MELSEGNVESALERIASRNEELAAEARHVYDALTSGEGPSQLSQAVVQDWLWYRLPTKYLTDEPGFATRMAAIAAALFDELNLDRYAAICRSQSTVEVHRAFDRSSADGYSALRRALDASGIEPPDTDSFRWGEIMGIEESMARTVVEATLEHAIDGGSMVIGARGWRGLQQRLTDAALDRDHPDQPGQTWRTAILTERIGSWIEDGLRRSEELGRLRSRIGNRLLHPVDPPADAAERMVPLTWLLMQFGDHQALTQAGYLNRAFVVAVSGARPWQDPFDTGRAPRTETDDITLHRLRGLLERAGALRKRGRRLERTKRGAAMLDDPLRAWSSSIDHLGSNPWTRFITETVGLLLIDERGPIADQELARRVASLAAEMGWRTDGDGTSPSAQDVAWAWSDSRGLMEVFGLLVTDGDWRSRHSRLTTAGGTAIAAMLRATAAGPRSR